ELVAHHRPELGLRLARGVGLGARGAPALELTLAVDGALAIGDVAQRDEPRNVTLGGAPPVGIDDPQLRGDRLATRPDDFDFRVLAGDDRKSELRSNQLGLRAP